MIIGSLPSLFWLMCLLAALLYIVAVILTQGATEYLKDSSPSVEAESMNNMYGSLWESMFTLFKCISGGVSWGEAAEPLLLINLLYFMVFISFIFFAIFSFVNIVTGVFVDSAIQTAERDRSIVTEKKRLQKQALIDNLLCLLEEIDKDGSGCLTVEELQRAFRSEQIINYFAALSIEPRDIQSLVCLLDEDGNGKIDIVEFVDGLQACIGVARSVDIAVMIKQIAYIMALLKEVLRLVGRTPTRKFFSGIGPGFRETPVQQELSSLQKG
mmetsp:Transcript_112999/g.282893  ORF Transcript_112999/g.282893 Transcript_112999/m.282893 type:complete len:270 (+) Transcript_112999:3-812(+)